MKEDDLNLLRNSKVDDIVSVTQNKEQIKVKVVSDNLYSVDRICSLCAFDDYCNFELRQEVGCMPFEREDKKSVIFIKLD